jgi:hypothetical protein
MKVNGVAKVRLEMVDQRIDVPGSVVASNKLVWPS